MRRLSALSFLAAVPFAYAASQAYTWKNVKIGGGGGFGGGGFGGGGFGGGGFGGFGGHTHSHSGFSF